MAKRSEWQRKVYKFIAAPYFDAIVGVIILLNAVVIGLEVEMSDSIDYKFFESMELVFVVVYVIEVLLRIYTYRLVFFTRTVNNADLVIVIFAVVALILMRASSMYERRVHKQMKTFSVFRVARLLRLVRVLRVSSQFQSLWMIVQGLITSISTVLWTAFLLFGVTYFFGVIACDHVKADRDLQKLLYDPINKKTVLDRFGNLGRSCLTLFDFFALDNISSKGYDIIDQQPLTIFFFLSFALIVPVVLLNLITAALVDMSLRSSAADREHVRAVRLAEWEVRVLELQDLFFRMTGATDIKATLSGRSRGLCCKTSVVSDSDDDLELPKLSKEQLISMCESKEVREHLNLLFGEPRKSSKGIDRLLDLWVVLDLDEDGEITLDEFTEGLGYLYDVIRNPNADAFVMLRLVKLHYMARTEREVARNEGNKHRERMHQHLIDRMDGLDRKLEVVLDRLGRTPHVPEDRMKSAPVELPCADSQLRMSL